MAYKGDTPPPPIPKNVSCLLYVFQFRCCIAQILVYAMQSERCVMVFIGADTSDRSESQCPCTNYSLDDQGYRT